MDEAVVLAEDVDGAGVAFSLEELDEPEPEPSEPEVELFVELLVELVLLEPELRESVR